MPPLFCLSANPPTWVHELIDQTTTSWRVYVLQHCMLHADQEIIRGIPLCTSDVDDHWEWEHEKRGIHNQNGLYDACTDKDEKRELPQW